MIREVPAYWLEFKDFAKPSVVECSAFTSSDGFKLIAYRMGEPTNPAILLACPLHVPFLAMYKIALELSRKFYVVSYECRGSAFLDEYIGAADPSMDRLAADLYEIVDWLDRPTLILGWCNSARVIALTISQDRVRPSGVVLISPSGTADNSGQHLVRSSMFGPLENLGEKSVERARIALANYTASPSQETDVDALVMSRLFGLNFSNGEKFRYYVKSKLRRNGSLPSHYSQSSAFDKMCSKAPVLVIQADNDDYISKDSIISALERNFGVECHRLLGAGHTPTISHWKEIADRTSEFYESIKDEENDSESSLSE